MAVVVDFWWKGLGSEERGEGGRLIGRSVGARGIRLRTRFWLAAGSAAVVARTTVLLPAVATAFVLFGGGASCSAYGIAVTTVKVSLTSFRLTSKLTPRLKSER